MGFQNKLFLTFSTFIILLVLVLGYFFYHHSSTEFEKNEMANLTVLSNKMSQQLDSLVYPMDFISMDLLSDDRVISSLTSLATIDRSQIKNTYYITEARQSIYSKIITYSIYKNFYRVSFMNKMGDFLTSNFKSDTPNEGMGSRIDELQWKKNADRGKGKMVLVPPYRDPWVIQNPIKVFSLVRAIQWPQNNIGYIEVQKPYELLRKIFEVPKTTQTRIAAFTSDGQLMFSNGINGEDLIGYYNRLSSLYQGKARQIENSITKGEEVVAAAASDYTGIRIILAQDRSIFMKPLVYNAKTTAALGVVILLLSLAYIYLFAMQLTKPIRRLKKQIEDTELETLEHTNDFESTNNEILALNKAYVHLCERLNVAVTRELESQQLQLRASYDSLQAQVNPHFIYNILNVLSNKGMENGDEEICEICDSIAGMLRYSTSTHKRHATIQEEIAHVRNYLLLMKKRYEHRLEYAIDVSPEILNEQIPKIVLQQIAENSVNHGFDSGMKLVRVDIKGYVKENWWYLEVIDNGTGFPENILQELRERMGGLKKSILSGKAAGLEIGGLGIINAYGRLALYYADQFCFQMDNLAEGGAKITIGSVLGQKEGGSLNV